MQNNNNLLTVMLRGGTQPSTQSVPYEANIGKIKRQRDIANLLRMQAMIPQQGQMVGGGGGDAMFGNRPGIYVGTTPGQALVRGLSGAASAMIDKNTDVQERDHENRVNDAYSLLGQGDGSTEELLNSRLPEARRIALAQIGQRPALENAANIANARAEAMAARDAQLEEGKNSRSAANIEAVNQRYNMGQDRADARARMRGAGGKSDDGYGLGIKEVHNEETGKNEFVQVNKAGDVRPLKGYTKPLSDKTRMAQEHNTALGISVDQAIESVTNNPKAFGPKTLAPDLLLEYYDPTNTDIRTMVNRLKSMQIKDFSGAAVSDHEQARMNSFLPRPGESAATILTKLKNFKNQLAISGHTMGLNDLPHNPATQPAVRQPSGIGDAINQTLKEAGDVRNAVTPAIPKTLTKSLGKPQAPAEAIKELMADPSPAAIAEFQQYFSLPPGVK